jgi:hypothetical protein
MLRHQLRDPGNSLEGNTEVLLCERGCDYVNWRSYFSSYFNNDFSTALFS